MADIEKTDPASQIEGNAPQGMRYAQIDPIVQKRVVRKLDFNLMPIVVTMCKLHTPRASIGVIYKTKSFVKRSFVFPRSR
jgi:hypothetical protein